MKAKTTEEIIALCKQKDEKAFAELYERFYPVAYRLALHIVKSEADAADVAQDTMISVYHHVEQLQYPQYFSLWLKRIVVGHCNRMFRKEHHVDYVNEDTLILKHTSDERTDHNPLKKLHFDSDKEVLDFFIAMLPQYQAEVVILYYFRQMSIKEIAYSLQVSTGTVKSRMFQAKQKLKKLIFLYEENEEIALNFHSDAILALLGGSMALTLRSWKSGTSQFLDHFLVKAVSAFALFGLAAAGVWYGISALSAENNQDNSAFHSKAESLSQTTVASPQDAYFRLLLMVDHADHMQYMDEQEQVIAQSLYLYLKNHGGSYYELIQVHGWE